ncbi:MAG TPA: transferrin receptor-like dimerization domain-containing protein [Terriglobia bacterium]|nr:transferrin receptor-like dimerization domain-containing protein [Terriglobia bacterium]
MRRVILSMGAGLVAVLLMGQAVDPAREAARPGGAIISTLAAAADSNAPLDGFSADRARAERDWESKFRALPSPVNMRSYMQRIAARPHHVGTDHDRANAEWILSLFQQWGWDAHLENFDVLFPTPKERLVELVAPTHFKATLEEPTVAGDPTTDQHAEQLPSYNAYSIDGDVTAPLVYVNYGILEDYEQLERLGISVKGAIVIARYGMSWRGIKPKVAAEHGAVGCIIYSDPHEDGYFRGDVFPSGAWRPPEGVQRGSVMDMVLYPGDPLTPGVGATKEANRLPLAEAKTITKIPVLPISYGDAQPLLAALRGPVAPEAWRGSLPITYHVGPGPAQVHLKMKSNWDTQPIRDVIARIPGAESPDEWIVRGNHEDAWVNGAEDPVSALVDELEEARSLGELLKQGWKPRRTIIYCVWDGEEPGLLGSTEWGEEHAEQLRQHAAVYLNTDANGRGYLFAGGSHTLERFMNGVARDIEDPETNLSVWKRSQLHQIGGAPEQRQEARTRPDLRLSALGSGSDYTVFVDHLGIASLNLGFGGEDGGGIYHSVYDDFYWYTHFSDTDFRYGRALAQTVGTAVLRLADSDLLPIDFTDFADTIHTYAEELKKLLKDKQEAVRERNQEIDEGVFTATADPKETHIPPAREDPPPYLNFAPLDNAADALTRSAAGYQKTLEKAQANGAAGLARASLQQVNQTLIESERRLTNSDGLPGRPWFQHQIYAPGFYTGYDVKTLPAVREAIEQKKWKEADAALVEVGKILDSESALILRATDELANATK